jgi:hypothetical protein
MTTGNPPRAAQKTLLGIPSDVQEALKKLQAQQEQQAKPPSAAAVSALPQPPNDLDRTQYGNPHDWNPPDAPSSASRPSLLSEQPSQPPARSSGPQASMQRTMLGIPSDVAAAFQQLQAGSPGAAASGPTTPPHDSRAVASADFVGWPAVAEPSSPSAQGPERSQSPELQRSLSAAQPMAAVAHTTQVMQQTAAARSGVVQKSTVPPPIPPRTTNATTREQPQGAPELAADGGTLLFASPASSPASPRAELPPSAPTAERSSGMHATRLVTSESGALMAPPSFSDTSVAALAGPALNSIDQAGPIRHAPVRRWPALSLLGLAVVAFGGVIAVRAPNLLPVPIAALLVRRPAVGAERGASEASPPPAAAIGETARAAGPIQVPQPAQPVALGQPSVAHVEAALPQAVKRSSAELEKQAIDLLLANDYAAARAVYERLRAAEPARPEYTIMLDLLDRELAPACGALGQVPCTTP